MTLKHLLAGAAVAAFMIAGAANAQTHIVGNETNDGGFVGDLFGGIFSDSYIVASDGEAAFDPFHAGYDTTDGLNFSGAVDPTWHQADGGHWNLIGDRTWVLPAIGENEPGFNEAVGHFLVGDGAQWNPAALGKWVILSAEGDVSDVIFTYNGDHGAELKFYSDPIGIPEPATWTIMLTGFFGMGALLRNRRKALAA